LFGSPARPPSLPPRVKRCGAIECWRDPGLGSRQIMTRASPVPNGSRIKDDQRHPLCANAQPALNLQYDRNSAPCEYQFGELICRPSDGGISPLWDLWRMSPNGQKAGIRDPLPPPYAPDYHVEPAGSGMGRQVVASSSTFPVCVPGPRGGGTTPQGNGIRAQRATAFVPKLISEST
jgi:hypothetical protein